VQHNVLREPARRQHLRVVSIRQHTSAYVSIRQHTSSGSLRVANTCGSRKTVTPQHSSAYVSVCSIT
jgi:hypothetical protein